MKAVKFTLSFCSFIALLIVLWEAIDAPWSIHKTMLNVENELNVLYIKYNTCSFYFLLIFLCFRDNYGTCAPFCA